MSLFSDEIMEQYSAWLSGFSNSVLVEHIHVLERLIDGDDLPESLLIDDGIKMLDLLKDECVRRVSVLASFDGPSLE